MAMKDYRVTGRPAGLATGRIRLTERQAALRAHCLELIDRKSGVYQVKKPVQFKIGEILGREEKDIGKGELPFFAEVKKAAP